MQGMTQATIDAAQNVLNVKNALASGSLSDAPPWVHVWLAASAHDDYVRLMVFLFVTAVALVLIRLAFVIDDEEASSFCGVAGSFGVVGGLLGTCLNLYWYDLSQRLPVTYILSYL